MSNQLFSGCWVPLSIHGSLLGSMCWVYIALQELQAVAFILGQLAFHLAIKVVALHFDTSIMKAYLCSQGGTVSPFFQASLPHLSSGQQTWFYLIPAYIPTHLSVEANFLSWGS